MLSINFPIPLVMSTIYKCHAKEATNPDRDNIISVSAYVNRDAKKWRPSYPVTCWTRGKIETRENQDNKYFARRGS